MDEITIGQILSFLKYIIGIAGIVATFYAGYKNLKKSLSTALAEEMEKHLTPIREKLDDMDEKIDKVDIEATKNFLVQFLSAVEQGTKMDEIQVQRFWEEYQHYEAKGGNSYIHKKVEKLQDKKLL